MVNFETRKCDCGGFMHHNPPTEESLKKLTDNGFTACYHYLPNRRFKCESCGTTRKLPLTDAERESERVRLDQPDFGLPFML
jgi:hypothetical protein